MSFSEPPNFGKFVKTFLVLACSLISLAAVAQAPAKLWDKTLGGSDVDYLSSMVPTADGGYILGGYSLSGVSGDKTDTLRGPYDYWVVKLDAAGNKQWDKTLGGTSSDQLTSLAQTTDGGYILGGYSVSNISGEKTEASKGGWDYWVVKLDANGNKLWDKTLGGNSFDYLYALTPTTDGGCLLGGNSFSNISGDKSENGRGNWDYWVVRLDASGNKLWDKTVGGNQKDELRSLAQTFDGGFILGGTSESGISGDKSQFSPMNYADYWIVKLAPNGTIQWEKTIGGSGKDDFYSLAPTTDGGYILGGTSDSGISGHKSEARKGAYDYWAVKLDGSGNKLWDKTIGGNFQNYFQSLAQTADGGYVLGGYSNSGISGDKSEASRGAFDFWVVKLDHNGSKLWDKTLGGSDTDGLFSLAQTAEGDLMLAGGSISGISGEKSETNRGDLDYWIVKIGGKNWTGAVSTAWTDAGNWAGGVVPGPATEVIIPVGCLRYPQISSAVAVQSLTLEAGTTSLTLAGGGALQVSGSLNLKSGSVFTTEAFSDLTLQGTWVNDGGTFHAVGGTVTFSSPTFITIPAFTYHNLVLQGSGTKTAEGNLTVNNDLVLDGSSLTFENNHTLTLKGHLENNALQTGNGKIVLSSGTAAHEISGTQPLQNLELNDALGAKLLNNIAANDLIFTQGILDTEGYTLTLNNNLIGENSTRYLKGKVARMILINGTGSHSFGNMGVLFNNTGGGNWGNVLVTRTTGSYVSNPADAGKKSILRRWNIQPAIQAATNVNLTLQWLRSEENGLIFPDSEAQIWKSEDSGQSWKPVEMLKPFTTNGDLRSMGVQTSSFSFWTVSDLNNPLPVTWLSFKGKAEAKSNLLTWATATEQNSSHFEVQRSFDGKQFEAIGTVKAAGNSNQAQHYTFSDENATVFAFQTAYYRLKQTDFDGKTEYSTIISLSRKPEILAISVYPNPFAETLTLDLGAVAISGKISLELVSLAGKMVYKTEEKVSKGQRILKLESLPAISSGLYLLKIRQHDQLTILKVNRQ